jgi:hypothetical protein
VVISEDLGHSGAAAGFGSTVAGACREGCTRDWRAALGAGFTAIRAAGFWAVGFWAAAGLGAGTGLAAAFALVPLAGLVRDGVFDAVRVAPEGVAFAMTRAFY